MDIPKGKPILCLDFDGVIHSYKSGWRGARCIPDEPVTGALEFIIKAVDHFHVCIYSSRSRYLFGRWAMRRWLKDKLMDSALLEPCPRWMVDLVSQTAFADPWYDESKWAIDRLVSKIKFPVKKPAAFIQIDDRAICFNGKFPSIDEIKSFKPWYRKESANV